MLIDKWRLVEGWWRRYRADGIVYAEVFPSYEFPGNWKWVIWSEPLMENCPQGESVGSDEAMASVDAILAVTQATMSETTNYTELFKDATECVAALEALKELVVLGAWKKTRDHVFERMILAPEGGSLSVMKIDGEWRLERMTALEFPESLYENRYQVLTAILFDVDMFLARMPNVRALGIAQEPVNP